MSSILLGPNLKKWVLTHVDIVTHVVGSGDRGVVVSDQVQIEGQDGICRVEPHAVKEPRR